MKKWAQGLSWKPVRAPFAPGTVDFSMPNSLDMYAETALYNLDKPNEPAYLCLTEDQDNKESVANQFEKLVQFIRG